MRVCVHAALTLACECACVLCRLLSMEVHRGTGQGAGGAGGVRGASHPRSGTSPYVRRCRCTSSSPGIRCRYHLKLRHFSLWRRAQPARTVPKSRRVLRGQVRPRGEGAGMCGP